MLSSSERGYDPSTPSPASTTSFKMLLIALIGFALGWLGSIPVAGPISALVVTRGIQGRFRAGAYIALGGGIAEAAYAFFAFWGFASFLTDYPIIEPISRGGGAVILFVLGVSFLRGKSPAQIDAAAPPRDSAWGSFMLGLSICGLNPALIATWTAVTTLIYSSDLVVFSSHHAAPFALGCALGISGWFVTLLWLIHRYRGRFTHRSLAKVVQGFGAMLLVVAFWFAYRFVSYFGGEQPAARAMVARQCTEDDAASRIRCEP